MKQYSAVVEFTVVILTVHFKGASDFINKTEKYAAKNCSSVCLFCSWQYVENVLLAEPSIPFVLVDGLGYSVCGVVGTVKMAMLWPLMMFCGCLVFSVTPPCQLQDMIFLF